ncbi:MAG: hypothetical protein KA226_13790 [Gemmatimonadales bacterium]|nr:hypothetical protein [Gemmatimonadales bacterium]
MRTHGPVVHILLLVLGVGCGQGVPEAPIDRHLASLPSEADGRGADECSAPSGPSTGMERLSIDEEYFGPVDCPQPTKVTSESELCSVAQAFVAHQNHGRAFRGGKLKIGEREGDVTASPSGELGVKMSDGFKIYCYSIRAGTVHLRLAAVALR